VGALSDLWAALAGDDAGNAYRAIWALSEGPRGVGFLREKLPPAALLKRPVWRSSLPIWIATVLKSGRRQRGGAGEVAELAAALEAACKAHLRRARQAVGESADGPEEGLSPVQLRQTRAVRRRGWPARRKRASPARMGSRSRAARLTQEADRTGPSEQKQAVTKEPGAQSQVGEGHPHRHTNCWRAAHSGSPPAQATRQPKTKTVGRSSGIVRGSLTSTRGSRMRFAVRFP
jgi:hypothetical protein